MIFAGAREMPQWLKVHTTPTEDPRLVPRTCLVAHNCCDSSPRSHTCGCHKHLGLSSKLSCHPTSLFWFCAQRSAKRPEEMQWRGRQAQPVCWILQVHLVAAEQHWDRTLVLLLWDWLAPLGTSKCLSLSASSTGWFLRPCSSNF